MLLTSSWLTAQAQKRPLAKTIRAPQLIGPTNGAETTGNPDDPNVAGRVLFQPLGIPTFRWEDVGAGKYELEVATTPAFGDDVILSLTDLRYPSFTPNGDGEEIPGFSLSEDVSGNFTDEATFYWHVRAWDSDTDQWSEYSSTWTFTRHWGYRPQLLAPTDNAVLDLTPQFDWAPVPGASFYQIQVDTSDAFGAPLIDATTDLPVFTSVASLPNDDDLFWRVRAFHRPNSSYGGPWSATHQFKLAWSSKLGTEDRRPLLLIPPNNANYINRPLFCWQPVAGADIYSIDLATHPEFVAGTTVFTDKKTEGTCYAFPRDDTYKLVENTTYYWRVTALDANNRPGQSTSIGGSVHRFTVAPSEPPVVPTLFYPPYYYSPVLTGTFENHTVAMPTFMWDHVPGADTYELCIDNDDPMDCTGTTAIVVQTANASFTFTDTATYPLVDGQTYYWKVRADVLGKPSWDAMRNRWKTRIDRSTIAVTDTLALVRPTYQVEGWSNGARYGQESLTYYPVFEWTALDGIGKVTYQIQIAHDEAFTNLVHDAETDFTQYTPLEPGAPGAGDLLLAGAPDRAGRRRLERNRPLYHQPQLYRCPHHHRRRRRRLDRRAGPLLCARRRRVGRERRP
jgi:hypothetical protein